MVGMKKNKPKLEPKYAPIIATPPEPRTTVPAKPVKPLSTSEAERQIKAVKASSEHTT